MKSKCTIQSVLYGHVHYIRQDLRKIADDDFLNASGLRIAGQKTDDRIDYLRKTHRIPDNQIPSDDLLWLSDLTLRECEKWSQHARGKTTFARVLAPTRRPHTCEGSHKCPPRTLQELGYLRARWIARRDTKVGPACAFASIYADELGTFLIVEDSKGIYQGTDGKVHDATAEGYTLIVQQFLYCIEAVNAAIAVLDGLAAPEPMPRWSPTTAKMAQKKNEASTGASQQRRESTPAIAQRDVKTPIILGGNLSSVSSIISTRQDIIDETEVSSGIVSESVEDLRHAPWSPETAFALASQILNVPPKPDASDAQALKLWNDRWYEPVVWACNATDTMEPARAWEQIERHIRGQLAGPTWQAEHVGAAMTLRHMVGPCAIDKPMTGVTWRTVQRELDAAQWYPNVTTPYEGPPLEYYAQGYQDATQITPEPTQSPVVIESVPVPPGMRQRTVERLIDEIRAMYPAIRLGTSPSPVDPERSYVGLKVSEDQWLDIYSFNDWRYPTPETQALIEQAVWFSAPEESAYSQALEAASPIEEEQELAPMVMEPPDSVAMPPPGNVSAIVPGLYLLPSPQPIENQVPIAPEPPPPVAGMIPMVAMHLIPMIEKRGYAVRQRPISADRVVLSVEISPGRWQDFASASAWYDRPRDGGIPPTDVGAVTIPLAAMQGDAVSGQAVSP